MCWDEGMGDQAAAAVPKSLLDGVVEQFHPVRVILFGSRARGDARPDSDYDLLVVVDDEQVAERRTWGRIDAARENYRGPVDILPWLRSRYDAQRGVVGSLPWTADREGVVVYGTRAEPLTGDPAGMRTTVAGDWLAAGSEDLRVARLCLAGDPPAVSSAAFHCQQCAEKLIKGCLILAESPFPRTHRLEQLIELLPSSVPAELVTAMRRVAGLTPWVVAGRYPGAAAGSGNPPTFNGVETAVRDLESLRQLVAAAIERA